MFKKIVFLVFLFGSIFVVQTQNTSKKVGMQNTYSDRLTDEYGVPIEGVTVRVRGTNSSDITNANGEFTVVAKKGSLIILSKNGKRINTYVYTGVGQYTVSDESEVYKSLFYEKLDSAIILKNNKPLQAITYVEKALENTKSKQEKAKAFLVLGDVYTKLKQYDLAKSNYELAYNVNKKYSGIPLKLATINFKLNNLKESKYLYQKVLTTKRIPYSDKIKALEGIGDILKSEHNFALALQKYQEALQIATKKRYASEITILSNKIAQIHALQGNLKKSKTYFGNSIQSAKKINKAEVIKQTDNAANFYRNNNQIDAEIALRKENLKELESIESDGIVEEKSYIPETKISKQGIKKDIGKALNKQKKYTEAIKYLEESVADASANNDMETEKEAIQGLTEAYVGLGDDSKALLNYKKYTKLVDLLYRKKEAEITKAVALGKELSKKQSRILSLEKDRIFNENKLKLVQTEQELVAENSKRQKTIIYSLLGGLLLLLLVLFFMFKSNKERKLANNLLALKSLRSQMNPHFIFNALNSVNSFIATSDERAANRYLTDFSVLMRSVLDNSEKDFIPLEQEVELLDLYLKLEHTRFSDKFEYAIHISDKVKLDAYKIPPMLIQPYVENAVWHGLRYKKEKGFLHINILENDTNSIKIEIIDNGIGREKSKELKSKNQLKQQSKGMQNIRQRIEILNQMYKDKVSVVIEDLNSDTTGTKVILTLKKKAV